MESLVELSEERKKSLEFPPTSKRIDRTELSHFVMTKIVAESSPFKKINATVFKKDAWPAITNQENSRKTKENIDVQK